MKFDYIDNSHKYLKDVLNIIRHGISTRSNLLKRNAKEGFNTQILVEIFNIIGSSKQLCNQWIGVQKEHVKINSSAQEDIYFHLNDDNHTIIFYAEAKRLPKYKTKEGEEYVIGISSTGNPSGAIQRYKIGKHGESTLKNNGIIAFIENKSLEEWLTLINNKLIMEYPQDSLLVSNNTLNEYTSTHKYIDLDSTFNMYHYWINLTN